MDLLVLFLLWVRVNSVFQRPKRQHPTPLRILKNPNIQTYNKFRKLILGYSSFKQSLRESLYGSVTIIIFLQTIPIKRSLSALHTYLQSVLSSNFQALVSPFCFVSPDFLCAFVVILWWVFDAFVLV